MNRWRNYLVNFNFPVTESILIYIGLAAIFIGLILFVIIFYRKLNRVFGKKKDDEEKPPPGCLHQIRNIFLIVLLIVLGFAIIFFGAFIQSLSSFNKQELVAEVLFQEVDETNHTMKMILIEKKGRNANVPQEFLLIGDRWFIRGDIIKWESWVNFLGLHTMYKLNRVGGFFSDLKMESELKPTHYSLVPEEETPKWRWLYKKGYELPFINNVYGSSVSQYPDLQKVFKIYVTIFGFSVGAPVGIEEQ